MGPKAAAQPAKVAVKLPQTITSDAIPKVSASIPKPSPTKTEKAIDCVNTSVKKEENKSPKSAEKIADDVKAAQANKPIETRTNQSEEVNVEIERTQPVKMDIDLVSLISFC